MENDEKKEFRGKKGTFVVHVRYKVMPPGREKWYGLRKMNP